MFEIMPMNAEPGFLKNALSLTISVSFKSKKKFKQIITEKYIREEINTNFNNLYKSGADMKSLKLKLFSELLINFRLNFLLINFF